MHYLMRDIGLWAPYSPIIIFVRERADADGLFKRLKELGYPALTLHGGIDQSDREGVIKDFKAAAKDLDIQPDLLIATGVAARGLDIAACRCVINFSVGCI